MGPYLQAVQAGAQEILTSLSAVISDVRFGAGEYRDFGDPAAFANLAAIKNDKGAAARAAIAKWAADGGGDTPEAQLFALFKVQYRSAPRWLSCLPLALTMVYCYSFQPAAACK